MDLEKKIAQFLATVESKPARSRLEPYDALIRALRQKRWTYKAIADALESEFGLRVNPKTIWDYLNVHQGAVMKQAQENSSIKPPQEPPRRRFNLDS